MKKEREEKMKKFLALILGLVFSLRLFGCAPVVKTDLKSFQEHPEFYQGKRVILTTDVKSVTGNPGAFLGKEVEVKGYVQYRGFREFPYWNFILKDEEGRSLRCYEREYRIDAWIWPVTVVRRAERKNEELTVVGKLERGMEIELDWIEYERQTINTDHKPSQIHFPFR